MNNTFFFCFIPQASETSMNFNISKMVYWKGGHMTRSESAQVVLLD